MNTSQSCVHEVRRAALPVLGVAALFIVVACGGSGGSSPAASLTTGSATNGSATNGGGTNGSGSNGSNAGSTNGGTNSSGGATGSSAPTWTTYSPAGGPAALNEAGNYLSYPSGFTTADYSPSFTASKSAFITVSTPTGLAYMGAAAVNSVGQIAAGAFANDSLDTIPFYWSSPSAKPVPLDLPAGVQYAFPAVISKGGVIVCRVINATSQNDYYLYTSPSAKPIKILSNIENGADVSISDSGVVVITTVSTTVQSQIFEAPYTGTPISVKGPSGSTAVGNAEIGPDGTIVGDDATGGFYMLPNQYSKPAYIGTNYFLLGVNSKEHMCGFHNGGGGNDNVAVWWSSPTAKPTTVKDSSTVQYTFASTILDDDSLVAEDDYGHSYYLLATAASAAVPGKR